MIVWHFTCAYEFAELARQPTPTLGLTESHVSSSGAHDGARVVRLFTVPEPDLRSVDHPMGACLSPWGDKRLVRLGLDVPVTTLQRWTYFADAPKVQSAWRASFERNGDPAEWIVATAPIAIRRAMLSARLTRWSPWHNGPDARYIIAALLDGLPDLNAPCPCASGRTSNACHGSAASQLTRGTFTTWPSSRGERNDAMPELLLLEAKYGRTLELLPRRRRRTHRLPVSVRRAR